MDQQTIITTLAAKFDIDVHAIGFNEAKHAIIDKINYLIEKDFEKLVYILYRLDVSEEKTKTALKAMPKEDAALVIVNLMIEREAEKIKTRQQFTQSINDTNEAEKL